MPMARWSGRDGRPDACLSEAKVVFIPDQDKSSAKGHAGHGGVHREQAFFDVARRHGLNLLKGKRLRHPEFARGGAAQGAEVAPAAELLAKIVRHRADIGAFAAAQAEIEPRWIEAHQFESRNPDEARLAFHFL